MKKVVLVGGGHSNIQVLKILHDKLALSQRDAVSLTLVAGGEVSYYSGMLPGAITQQYRPEEIQIPLRPLAYSCGAHFFPSTMTALDPIARTLTLSSGETVPYDIVSIDIGSRSRGTDSVPGVSQYALMTRPLNIFFHSIEIRERELKAKGEKPTVAVVGGGVAGVELAFSFASRWNRVFDASVPITLLCATGEVLPGYPDTFRNVVLRNLQKWGIGVEYRKTAAEVTATGVRLTDGDFLERNVVVWATGAEPHSLSLNLPLCPNGFLLVNDYLQTPNYPEIFGGGDCITIQSQPRGFPPKAGVYAVREGPVIASNIMALIQGTQLEKYNPQSDFLCLVNTGDNRALGGKYGIMFAGPWVWELKDYIDRSFMTKYSPLALLGTRGLAVYEETKGESMEPVYASREQSNADYSCQFGLEKDPKLAELERRVDAMSPSEAVSALLDSSDIFAPNPSLDYQVNFQIVKRLGVDDSFRSSCISLYTEEFLKRVSA